MCASQEAKPATATSRSVYGSDRVVNGTRFDLPDDLKLNQRLKMDGQEFLRRLPADAIPAAFFDPQYRGVLDKLGYGNEGESRGRERSALRQMTEATIGEFISGIARVLMPSGHLFLWMDKFHLCSGFSHWFRDTDLEVVDLITWSKGRIGMGYRTRRSCEYLVVLQHAPQRAKGVWKLHTIPDVWTEKVSRGGHAHRKPVDLQAELIRAVSNEGEIIIDPAAGSYSVLEACQKEKRDFLGCDLND